MSWKDRAQVVEQESGIAPVQASSKSWKDRAEEVHDTQEQSNLVDTALTVGSGAIEGVTRGADWLAGMTRLQLAKQATPAKMLLDVVRGKKPTALVHQEDDYRALVGKAPDTAEFLDRAQVPSKSATIPFFDKEISSNDVIGLAGDIATDPLTFVGAGAAGKLKVALSPTKTASDKTGRFIYKSAFSKVDDELEEKGAKALSDTLLENGAPTGSARKIEQKSQKIVDNLLEERGEIYDQINKSGNKGNVLDAMTPAIERSKELVRKNPGLEDQAAAMENWLLKYGRDGDLVDVGTLSDWKSSLYQGLPQTAFGPNGKAMPLAKEVQQAFARGFKEQIEKAGEKTSKGLGKRVAALNEDVGSILSASKPLSRQAKSGAGKNLFTSVDGMISGAATANPAFGIPTLALKKSADLAKTTWARTHAGKALMSAADTDLLDPAMRQLWVESQRSPWTMMTPNQ